MAQLVLFPCAVLLIAAELVKGHQLVKTDRLAFK